MIAPTVSVIIPLLNKGPHISRALDSVISQSFQDFEVIVVDGGSTDGGVEIVDRVRDSRINLIRQKGDGVSTARNQGVEIARGSLIAFLDADDEWLPEHLETILRLQQIYPEAGALCTAHYRNNGKDPIGWITPSYFEIPKKPWEGLLNNYFKSATFGDPPVITSTVAIPKNIFFKMGGFDENTWWGEDTDLWGRIALKYPIAFSWDGAGIYHTDTINRACDCIKPVVKNIFITSAENALRANEVSPSIKMDLLEYVAKKQIQTASRNMEAGRSDLARWNLKNCKTMQLRRPKYYALFWSCVPSWLFIKLKIYKLKFISNFNM